MQEKFLMGKGLLGVNIMVTTSEYALYAKRMWKLGVDAIISGAGLPLNLPELTKGSDVLIAPIVSSAKALNLILRSGINIIIKSRFCLEWGKWSWRTSRL